MLYFAIIFFLFNLIKLPLGTFHLSTYEKCSLYQLSQQMLLLKAYRKRLLKRTTKKTWSELREQETESKKTDILGKCQSILYIDKYVYRKCALQKVMKSALEEIKRMNYTDYTLIL